MKRSLWMCACLALFTAAPTHAQAPSTMSYQGVLTDGSGNLVADGNYDVTFNVYDVALAGAPLWTEAHADVPVERGGFSVILGLTSPLSLAFDKTYWLGVAVEGEAELIPRVRLASSPSALSLRLPFSQTLANASALFSLDNTGAGPDAVFAGRAHFGTGASNGEFRLFRNGVGTEVIQGYTSNLGGRMDFRDEAADILVQIAPDGDGTGGYLNVYRPGAVTGVSLVGNYAASGESGLTIEGSARSCFFIMANPGNSSVSLPTDAISALETKDEAGVASANGTATVFMDGTVETILSRSISVPDDGYCLVIGSAEVDLVHTNGTVSIGTFGVSAAAGSLPGTQDVPVEIPSTAPTGNYTIPVTVHGLFSVTAGANTFYLLGDEGTGSDLRVSDRQLSVVYFPTAYGTVTSTMTSGTESIDRDEGRAARLGPGEIARERQEAERFHADRLERELRAMRAELDRIQVQLGRERAVQAAAAAERR